jgi:hypothetical protein
LLITKEWHAQVADMLCCRCCLHPGLDVPVVTAATEHQAWLPAESTQTAADRTEVHRSFAVACDAVSERLVEAIGFPISRVLQNAKSAMTTRPLERGHASGIS